MKLNQWTKILVAVGTIWICLYPLLFISMWFSTVTGMMQSAPAESPFSMPGLAISSIFPLHCLTALIQFSLMAFYLFHILKNTQVSDVVRGIFGIGVFMMPYLAMPAYYIFFIWRSVPPSWALPKAPPPATEAVQPGQAPVPAQPFGPSKKKVTLVVGILGIVTLVILGALFVSYRLMNNFDQALQNSYFAEPTPVHYNQLPAYMADQPPLYQPVDLVSFTPINTFKALTTWRENNHVPILINGDTILIAGYLNHPSDNWHGSVNVDLFSADIPTGKIHWQTTARSADFLKDGQYIYCEAPYDTGSFGPASLITYDASTGSKVWETTFKNDYAAGIGYMQVSPTELQVETYKHGVNGLYSLDKATGAIKDFKKQTSLNADDQVVFYDGMQFKKQGYRTPDQITVTRAVDGAVLWKYNDETVVSNIAVGGAITYVLTDKNHLIALDTKTGEVLGKLAFAPRFARDFDFVNTYLIVAAERDVVAVYYEDSQQLSVFRFTPPAK